MKKDKKLGSHSLIKEKGTVKDPFMVVRRENPKNRAAYS